MAFIFVFLFIFPFRVLFYGSTRYFFFFFLFKNSLTGNYGWLCMWDLYADGMVVLILYTISKIGVVGIRLGDFI